MEICLGDHGVKAISIQVKSREHLAFLSSYSFPLIAVQFIE